MVHVIFRPLPRFCAYSAYCQSQTVLLPNDIFVSIPHAPYILSIFLCFHIANMRENQFF